LTEKFSKVSFEILKHVVRSCEEKHYTDDRSNPMVSNEMFLIDLIEMRIVTSPAGEGYRRYCALSYVVSIDQC
jgi:hypothetical protein